MSNLYLREEIAPFRFVRAGFFLGSSVHLCADVAIKLGTFDPSGTTHLHELDVPTSALFVEHRTAFRRILDGFSDSEQTLVHFQAPKAAYLRWIPSVSGGSEETLMELMNCVVGIFPEDKMLTRQARASLKEVQNSMVLFGS